MIERFGPQSIARVISVAAVPSFALYVVVALMIGVARSHGNEAGLSIGFSRIGVATIVIPFVCTIGVYIASFVGSFAFSAATRLVGGIQLELSD